MLSPEYLKDLGIRIENLYAELEDDLISDIVRRIVSTDFQITQSAVWQAEVLQNMGVLRRDILKRVSNSANANERFISDLFEEGGTETLAFDDEVYNAAGLKPMPIKQSPAMLQIISTSAKKCCSELKNLTRTTAVTSSVGFGQICDKAYMQVISGGFDYNTAVRNAVKAAGRAGVKVIYPRGGTAQLDVAVRRAVVTGVSQTAGQLQIMRIEEMGADLVETSAHFDARPDHAEWQGQVFYYNEPVEGYESFIDVTGYGSGDGLMGWNCRHSFFPYFEGISKRAYTDDELFEMKEHTVTYGGKEYSDYEASQTQRRMEREIRATKREILAIDKARNESGISVDLKEKLSQDYTATSLKLAQQNEKLADFLDRTGRGESRARLTVDGFDRSHAQASIWTARKPVDNHGKSGIIEYGNTSNGIKITHLSKHFDERKEERGFSGNDVLDALKNPLYVGEVRYDVKGRPSQRFIGYTATVNINPQTGVVATGWKTGKRHIRKYGGGNSAK